MSTMINVFGALLLVLFLTDILAHTTDNMKKLISDKTKDYNRKFRPTFDQSETIRVSVSFELKAIQEFDEVSEKFSVVGFIIMAWRDLFLRWDPKDYGNMTGFAAEGGDFWKPSLVLVNSHDDIKVLSDNWSVFRYTANGNVVVTSGAVFDATCSVDVTKYPWDEQNCFLDFVPLGYFVKEVEFVTFQKRVGLKYYGGNGAWDIVDTVSTVFVWEGVSTIRFHMTLRRKPRFVLVNVILPIVFMSFLNMVVFLIPTDSGERISYCLTVLLALAVFLTLVGDNLPKTSNPMSLLSYYLLAVMIISVCIIFATIFSLRIYFRDEKQSVPGWLASFVRCMCCRYCCEKDGSATVRYECRSSKLGRKIDSRDEHPPNYRSGDDSRVYTTNDLLGAPAHHGNRENRTNDVGSYSNVSSKCIPREVSGRRFKSSLGDGDDDNDDNKVSWKDVSCTVDMLFFFLFVLLLSVTTSVYFFLVLRK